MTVADYRKMSRRAYVNSSEGWAKVILGNDEYQIIFNGLSGIEAKKAIAQGNFSVNDVQPAVVCETVAQIRRKLLELSEEVGRVYSAAKRNEGSFRLYDQATVDKTDKLAYEITHIMTYGI